MAARQFVARIWRCLQFSDQKDVAALQQIASQSVRVEQITRYRLLTDVFNVYILLYLTYIYCPVFTQNNLRTVFVEKTKIQNVTNLTLHETKSVHLKTGNGARHSGICFSD